MIGAAAALCLGAASAWGQASDWGDHAKPAPTETRAVREDRRVLLEEMWQRRILPPDARTFAPADLDFLLRLRAEEGEAIPALRARFGSARAWTVRSKGGGLMPIERLTKEGHEKYAAILAQEAISYFESKGAPTKTIFSLRDWDGRPLFDGGGRLTTAGEELYGRAKAKRTAYWRGPDGAAYGTRKPPPKNP